MIDRGHMITCDKKCTINLVSIAFAVSGNIDFFERPPKLHHRDDFHTVLDCRQNNRIGTPQVALFPYSGVYKDSVSL